VLDPKPFFGECDPARNCTPMLVPDLDWNAALDG
jgi:hypothetical protein